MRGYAAAPGAPGQLEQHRRFALGSQQADLELGVRPFGVLQVQAETLHAAIPTCKKRRQVVDQPAQGEQQRLVRFDIEVQLQPRLEPIRRLVERQPQGAQAEQLVQVQLHVGGEAPGQGIAWQRQNVAEPAQAHAGEGLRCRRRQPDLADRHAGQGRPGLLGRGHGQAVMAVGEHARGHRVGRQDNALAQPQRIQLLAQARLEHRPGPEQPQAGADFQQQGPRVVPADLGAEAVGPGGQQLLELLDARRVGFHAGEAIGQGTGGGEGLPGTQDERGRSRVDRLHDTPLLRPADQHQGRVGVVTLTQEAVQCQLWKDDARPEHGSSTPPRAGDGRGRWQAATALEDPPLGWAGIDGDAQSRRRRVVRGLLRSASEGQSVAGLGSHLLAPQGAVIAALGPAQHCSATAGAQTLLGCPQGVSRRRLDLDQPAQVDPSRLPGRCIGNERRRHQHHPPPFVGKARQARPEQLQLATARAGQQQFAERSRRPASVGQPLVKGSMTGGLQALRPHLGLTPTPDPALVEQAVEVDYRAHQSRLNRPQNTPSMTKSRSGVTSIGA